MMVVSETIDPERLVYRLDYGNLDYFHRLAVVNDLKRALAAVEHHYYDDIGRIKKTRLIYTDGFESYREFSPFGKLITDDNLAERVEFDYLFSTLTEVRVTRPINFKMRTVKEENKGKIFSKDDLETLRRVLSQYPWGKNFHPFNPFNKENLVSCGISGMSDIARHYDKAILPAEYLMDT